MKTVFLLLAVIIGGFPVAAQTVTGDALTKKEKAAVESMLKAPKGMPAEFDGITDYHVEAVPYRPTNSRNPCIKDRCVLLRFNYIRDGVEMRSPTKMIIDFSTKKAVVVSTIIVNQF